MKYDVFYYALANPGRPLAFAADTLGIEMTDPLLAIACGLGNIDPQHGKGAKAGAPAAVEVALDYPLPPVGTHLVTMRADLDALGAMALLALRADGRVLDFALRARVRRIAEADRFDRGRWPGPRELPTYADELLRDEPDAEVAVMAACAVDETLTLADRVRAVASWLLEGAVSAEHLHATRTRANRLAMSVHTGRTQARPVANGRIVTVVSTEPGALRLGYRLAPIVVALNPEFGFGGGTAGRKYTVARWSAEDLDLASVLAELRAFEPGWGGQAGIVGSPQGQPSWLPMEKVVASVAAVLDHSGAPRAAGAE